jgi:hypothetical protein
MANTRKDLTGQRFGRLTVLAFDQADKYGQSFWRCRCDCGAETVVRRFHLLRGGTQSCGCIQREVTRKRRTEHGHWAGGKPTPEWAAWHMAKLRCHCPTNRAYSEYGGRGIVMCDRWRFGEGEASGFECFISDMGMRPSPQHSLERSDNNKGYDPRNCYWATRKEQQRNRRCNRHVEFRGQKMTLAEAAEVAGLFIQTLARRLNTGWSIEDAMTIPPRSGNRR